AAMGYDGRVRTVRKASYREGCRTTRIINSEGLDRGYKATFLSCSVTAVAEEGGDAQMGWEMGCGHHITDLDVVQVGESAAKRAVSMLGARSMSPVRCPLLIENTVVCELLDVLGASFLVENVEKGKSMLKGKRGERVAADSITIRDNGRLPGGWGSAPFDGEGAPTQTTPLVVEGVCHGYLSDTYWSKRSGEKATGNAVRSTFRNLPRVGTTNLSMEGRGPGVEALMSGMEKGFYVTDLLGVHTINAVTGEFSLGAAGYRVEGGKISFPVRGMALSGNLLELLLKIEEVGDDVRYRGSISAPSIVVSDMEVSGAT
ncbi:MAG: TldD/PmbA family protein, partial [Thermodesulfobacteriota bacterium]